MILKRQGDMLFQLLDAEAASQRLVQRWKNEESGVIAKGETTGHVHRLNGGEVVLSRSGMLLEVPDGGTVSHEEHNTIELEPGVWLVHNQVEYLAPGENVAVYD